MLNFTRTCRLLSGLFWHLCWLTPLLTIYMIVFHLKLSLATGFLNDALRLGEQTIQHLDNFSYLHLIIICIIQSIPMLFTVLIFKNLSRLFAFYHKGQFFERVNTQTIRAIAIYLLVGELSQLIYQPLMTLALSLHNEVGKRFISISFGTTNLTTILTGVIVLIIAWIFSQAEQLNNEAKLTI